MVSDHKELHMMRISSRYHPKKSESNPDGEDAHTFSATRGIIIVCDGVSGRPNKGIDSGVYARKLVLNTAAALEKQQQQEHDVNPKEALLEAHANTTSAKGSSTACVIALANRNKLLRFANVGDSGFVVFRGRRVVYRSRRGQRFFNHPYQLAEWKSKSDVSRVVDEGEVEVEAGDVVVAGSDGLFDNLFVSEIGNILQETSGGGGSSEKLALRIASRALSNSRDRNYESPFQREAWLAGKPRLGGKYDDITVVAEIGVRAGVVMECKPVTMGQISWANIVKMRGVIWAIVLGIISFVLIMLHE